jgi:hypothetical protein
MQCNAAERYKISLIIYISLHTGKSITVAAGLRLEISSSAGTLCSWVRIPLNPWMSVYIYSVSVLVRGLATS